MQYVILEGKNLHETNIKSLATSLKKLCFFGTQIFPANLKELKRRGSKDFSFTETEMIGGASDSEHSDNESQNNSSTNDRFSFFFYWNIILDIKHGK